MEITKDRALRRLRDLIEYYNISRCEGIPGDIPVVEVPIDKCDILAIQMAINAIEKEGKPITTSGKIRKDAKKIMKEGDPDAH